MDDKKNQIIENAVEVFSRYGVRRTTMGDIAEHCGVSRQTLYASYANKEEVLKAAIRHLAEMTGQQIEQAWAQTDSVSERLDAYLQLAVVHYYEKMCQMPDAADLMQGFREMGADELKCAEDQKMARLEVLFEPYADQLKSRGTTPKDMAELFQTSSSNFKYVATDMDQLQRLLGALKQSTLVMLGEA